MKFKEGQDTELKKSLADIDEILKSIVAFANSSGGNVYIGVDDEGKVVGVSVGANTLENLAITISKSTDPHLLPEMNILSVEEKNLIEIIVDKSRIKPHFFKGVAYKRAGKTNLSMAAGEIKELLKVQAVFSFEDRIVESFDFKDIDKELIKEFIKKAEEKRGLKLKKRKIREVFKYLNLIIDGKPTIALVLCFAKDPSKYITHYTVKFGVLGSDQFSIENLVFQTEIRKPLLRAVEDTEGYYLRYLPKKVYLRGFERIEEPLVPLSSLREFTINALMHADYSIPSPIYVLLAKSYIEISNPGESLVRPLSRLYEKHRSLARNPKIANIFFLAGYVERWGEGINNAIRNLLGSSLPFPKFAEENSFFTSKISIQPDDVLGRMMTLLSKPKRTAELAKKIGVSERLIRKKISLLRKRGSIKKIRKGKEIFYKLTAETPA